MYLTNETPPDGAALAVRSIRVQVATYPNTSPKRRNGVNPLGRRRRFVDKHAFMGRMLAVKAGFCQLKWMKPGFQLAVD